MGQGTSKYRKIMRTPQTGENAGKKLWYATAVSLLHGNCRKTGSLYF